MRLLSYDQSHFIARLIAEEGRRLFAYDDHTGVAPLVSGKLTIGVGRNLTDKGLRADEVEYLLRNDIAEVEDGVLARFPWITALDPVRQEVLMDMAFNMGPGGVATFTNTLAHVRNGEWAAAAAGMRASAWASQVGARAQNLAAQMESGKYVP